MQRELSKEIVTSKQQKVHLLKVIEELTLQLKASKIDQKAVKESTS